MSVKLLDINSAAFSLLVIEKDIKSMKKDEAYSHGKEIVKKCDSLRLIDLQEIRAKIPDLKNRSEKIGEALKGVRLSLDLIKTVKEANGVVLGKLNELSEDLDTFNNRLTIINSAVYSHLKHDEIGSCLYCIEQKCNNIGDFSEENLSFLEGEINTSRETLKKIAEKKHFIHSHTESTAAFNKRLCQIDAKVRGRREELVEQNKALLLQGIESLYQSPLSINPLDVINIFCSLPSQFQMQVLGKLGVLSNPEIYLNSYRSENKSVPLDHKLCKGASEAAKKRKYHLEMQNRAMLACFASELLVYPKKTLQILNELSSGFNTPCFIPIQNGDSYEVLKEMVKIYNRTSSLSMDQKEEAVLNLLQNAEASGLPLNGENGVYYWVWKLAHEKDPAAGGEGFGQIHAPKDLECLLHAIEKVYPTQPIVESSSDGESGLDFLLTKRRENFSVLPEIALDFSSSQESSESAEIEQSIESIAGLKARVESLEEKSSENLQKLLDEAAQNEVNLKRVHYWIWYLAHEVDSEAGGDGYGQIHAAKDAARLAQAIERALTEQ